MNYWCRLLPSDKTRGRPRSPSLWDILNGILYVLCEGCTWRGLPGDFPAWQTVYTYFRRWKQDGTWLEIHEHLYLYILTRRIEGREPSPSELIVDSQRTQSATMIAQAVGHDAAKKTNGGALSRLEDGATQGASQYDCCLESESAICHFHSRRGL